VSPRHPEQPEDQRECHKHDHDYGVRHGPSFSFPYEERRKATAKLVHARAERSSTVRGRAPERGVVLGALSPAAGETRLAQATVPLPARSRVPEADISKQHEPVLTLCSRCNRPALPGRRHRPEHYRPARDSPGRELPRGNRGEEQRFTPRSRPSRLDRGAARPGRRECVLHPAVDLVSDLLPAFRDHHEMRASRELDVVRLCVIGLVPLVLLELLLRE
jgi:hypothetical protein